LKYFPHGQYFNLEHTYFPNSFFAVLLEDGHNRLYKRSTLCKERIK